MADFPEMGLVGVDIKIDSGAYTSSMHVKHLRTVFIKGKEHLIFKPLGKKMNADEIAFDEFKTKIVKSSNGTAEERYSVKTDITLFGTTFKIEMTLTNRGSMKYPVLIGRKVLSKRFVVDVSETNLSAKGIIKKLN